MDHQTWHNGKGVAQYLSNGCFMLDVPVSNADGSKTPTASLVNRPGCSSTIANLDRFHNQEVPYASEEMALSEFEFVESLSTSPTSVRTPDDDMFEQDSKDFALVRDFYQHDGISPQSRQGQAGVMDVSVEEMEYFNNCFSQDPQAHFMSTIPRQLDTQPYNQFCATAFTQQPPQHDPWSSVRQHTDSDVPRSDSLIWDPESDFSYMGQVGPTSSNFNYTLSSNSLDGLSLDSQYYGDPMELQLSIPNTSLANYSLGNSSSMFSEGYVQVPRGQTSPEATSVGAFSGFSPYQAPTSPFVNIPSPLSDGVFSYQASDPGSTVDTAPALEQFHNTPSPTPTQNSHALRQQNLPDPILCGLDPPAPRTQRPSINRPGGRQLGSHLKPEVAKDAHDMRKVVACWHCVLQRDKVRLWLKLLFNYHRLTGAFSVVRVISAIAV
jgi:hypothetical protein